MTISPFDRVQMVEVRITRSHKGGYSATPTSRAFLEKVERARTALGQLPVTLAAESGAELADEFVADLAPGRASYDLAKGLSVTRRVPADKLLKWYGEDVASEIANPTPLPEPEEEEEDG
jgi:hypothetical protein